jgi:hypothetical protein
VYGYYNPKAALSGIGSGLCFRITEVEGSTTVVDQAIGSDYKLLYPQEHNPATLVHPYIKGDYVSVSSSGSVSTLDIVNNHGTWVTPDGLSGSTRNFSYTQIATNGAAGAFTHVFDVAFSTDGSDGTIFAQTRVTVTLTITI